MESLGARVPLQEALTDGARFRVQFTNDMKTREMRWVLFTSTRRGAIGKLIFTLEKDGQSAHVKSIIVNKEWRGRGLARILYLACVSTLMELHVPELHLEAEEDTRRHGKLVGLYEQWGFAQKTDSKVLFLYNDTECFRKVPMMISFQSQPASFFPSSTQSGHWFHMIVLQTSDGACLVATEEGDLDARREKSHESMWQTLLGPQGEIFLRSVYGKFLCVEDTGTVLADRPWNSTWETFQVVPHHSADGRLGRGVALKNFHGGYLSIDADAKKVVSSEVPVAWDGGEFMSLVCNNTDAKPIFQKIMRKYQTQAFVQAQIDKYGTFQRATMGIPEACKALQSSTHESESTCWALQYMMASAELVREQGHPDWLQLAAFLRGLGLLFLLWTDEENAILRSISTQEWLTSMTSWVLGSGIPSSLPFPELNELNADHCLRKKSPTAEAHCGLGNVLLPWTPDEYIYRVLQFNRSSLPDEALYFIRYGSLASWYRHGEYDELCNAHDLDMKEWMCSLESLTKVDPAAMQDVRADKLLPYYFGLAEKYLPTQLHW